MFRPLFLTLILFFLVPYLPTLGQETKEKKKKYTFQPYSPQQGIKYLVEEEGKSSQKIFMGPFQPFQSNWEEEKKKYRVEILEVKNKIPRKVAFLFHFWEKATKVAQMKKVLVDKKETFPVLQKKIIATYDAKGQNPSFQLEEGGKIIKKAFLLLKRNFGKAKEKENNFLFPNHPIGEGETWKIDPKKVLKAFRLPSDSFDIQNTEIKGVLKKVFQEQKTYFGDFEISIKIPLLKLKGIKIQEGQIEIQFKGTICLDGTSPKQEMNMNMELKAKGEARGMKVILEMFTQESRKTKMIS